MPGMQQRSYISLKNKCIFVVSKHILMAYIYIQKARRSKTTGCDIIRLLPFMFARKNRLPKLQTGTSNQNILNPTIYTGFGPNIFIPDDRIHMHVNFKMGVEIPDAKTFENACIVGIKRITQP